MKVFAASVCALWVLLGLFGVIFGALKVKRHIKVGDTFDYEDVLAGGICIIIGVAGIIDALR